ncbi:MAG TPA: cytochrome c biogenesis protein CcdA, partial [Gemmatimonadaceae bacterium]|nr:cytochrome c biogenesis protein CcdA [Gemmatimonadaceae bacterium]
MSPGFLWLAVSAGFLSLLTPCVFPMIPITVAYFAGDGTRSRSTGIRKAIFFTAGIVATFTALGLTIASLFGASGLARFSADTTVNLVLAALFVVFALNLFGWIELRVPTHWITRADAVARRAAPDSPVGGFLMGAVFSLTSFTCTAPFVGSLLVLASRGEWQTPLAGMVLFSLAFAAPFVALALVPDAVSRLPRSGRWLHTVRVMIGLLEIAAAIKFVSNADLVNGWGLLSRSSMLLIWSSLALVGGIYLSRRAYIDSPVRFWRQPGLAAVCFALAAWLISGMGGRRLAGVEAFLPPRTAALAAAGSGHGQWILNDYDGALATARQIGRLVFVDFTGYTCTNCRWMEANIFERADVSAELDSFVLSRLYTDGEGEKYERQQEFQEKTFGTVALPLYAVVDGSGKIRAT